MRVFLEVYDNIYQGLYGLSSQSIIEIDSVLELEEYYYEDASWLLDSYSCYQDYIADFDEGSDYVSSLTSFEAWKIKDDVPFSVRELDEKLCSMGKEDFINAFCDADVSVYDELN